MQADDNDDDGGKAASAATIGSPENIDHILDNMFVQRAPYQPPSTTVAATLPKSNEVTAEVVVSSEITAGELDDGVSVRYFENKY